MHIIELEYNFPRLNKLAQAWNEVKRD